MSTRATALATVPSAEDRRDSDRVEVALWGRIRFRGTSHPARICNLSPGGLMAMTPFKLANYSEIDIEVPVLGWRTAIVAWSKGDRLGCEFDPPLKHSLFDRFANFEVN